MTLKDIRTRCKLTQEQASLVVGVSRRTFVSYENDESKADTLKLERIKEKLTL